jgi:nitrogen fixation NifU-like protein
MASEADLYQAEILALAAAGKANTRLESPDASARVDNPLCGDRVTIDLRLEDGRVTEIGHRVQGCALCQAAAAVIAREAIGADAETIGAVRNSVAAYLSGETDAAAWGRLSVFAPVRAFKSRHECVLLPFTAVEKAMTSGSGR